MSAFYGVTIEWKGDKKVKRTCIGTSFGEADLNLEYCIIVLTRFIILTN